MEEVSNRVFVDPVSYLNRFIKDIKDLRGSFLLMAVFWPVAIITVFLAQVERFWAIGSSYNNSSHLVSDNNEEIMNLMLMLSSSELSKKIRDTNDSLTSVALVTACIGQIRKTNVFLNAVVVSRFAKALEEAEAADAAVRMNTIPENSPFWGVPLVIKECMEMPNMAYTTGIVSRKHIVGTNIAVAVQHTIDAGGIIVATTNVSEGCMWHESFNQVYGRSYNPYDFGRTTGGSSGGCGAGVAACMVPMAIASDVGGSIRIPSFYNGIFGHKPTGGAVSNAGTIPSTGEGMVDRYCQLGPMSRHADDLWPLLNAIAGVHSTDKVTSEPGADKMPLSGNRGSVMCKAGVADAVDVVDISSLHVYHCTHNLGHPLLLSPIHPEIISGIDKCVEFLTSQGCSSNKAGPSDSSDMPSEMFSLLNAFSMWAALMSREKPEPFSQTIREETVPFAGIPELLLEAVKSIFNLSNHTFPAILLSLAEYATALVPSENERNCALADKVKVQLHAALKDKVMIMPSIPTPAPMHNESIIRIFDTSNTSFFNIMEVPVTAVPLGLNKDGLPIGLQVVGGHGQDHITIAVAKALQRAGIAKWQAPRAYHK